MNDKRLQIYLDDHVAIMVGEIELAGRCARSNQGTGLGEFLEQLENQVKAQQSVANDVIYRIGGTHSVQSRLKQSAAWMAEKLGRCKLNDTLISYSHLSRVVELEALSAAAQERIALWDNLAALGVRDHRLKGISFAFFLDQSNQHLDQLNVRRRHASARAFADGSGG